MTKGTRSVANDARIDVRRLTEQRLDTINSGEARKGVNILQTSDPQNPAQNPFVHTNNNGNGKSTTATVGNDQEKTESSKS
jgi:hypothetical protein